MNPLCACGCGELIPDDPRRRKPARFLKYHHLRAGIARKPRYVPTPEETPSGVCECGCGSYTPVASVTYRRKRYFAGYPTPFMPGHHARSRARGENAVNWKGGRTLTAKGYVLVYQPEHPAAANQKGYVKEHRLVMERHLGRFLTEDEVVHHINGVRGDNRLENLKLMRRGEHSTLHAPYRKYDSEKMRAAGRKGAAARWGER